MGFPTGSYGPSEKIFTESATQKAPLGTRLVLRDGRVFRYVKNGGVALVVGNVLSKAVAGADHIKDLVVAAIVAVGGTTVTVTNGATTAITANMFRDGYLYMNDAAGEAHVYTIKSHNAAATGAVVTIQLYDWCPVQVALAATSECGLCKSMYDGVIQAAVAVTAPVVGVAIKALTISYYGWIQTWGPASVLTVGNVLIGAPVSLITTAGCAGPTAAVTTPPVGVVMAVAAATEHSLIFLTIAP